MWSCVASGSLFVVKFSGRRLHRQGTTDVVGRMLNVVELGSPLQFALTPGPSPRRRGEIGPRTRHR